jgi:hypothetical protein
MTDIANLFINMFNDESKPINSITDNALQYKKSKSKKRPNTPALNQGDKFLFYQKKIKQNLAKEIKKSNNMFIEGFQSNSTTSSSTSSNGITSQSKQLLSSTNMSSDQQKIIDLKKQYKESLAKYQIMLSKIKDKSKTYFDRVSPKNPYLNKNIYIGGSVMYVTNQGIAKWYPSDDILQNTTGINGCPAHTDIITIPNIPWDSSYQNAGATIPTTPPLKTGTPMTSGQACGKEGTNVFVDQMLSSDASASYVGVYGNNTSAPMTFIGGTPPSDSGLQNGNFDTPSIAADSYSYIDDSTTVPGWTFTNAVLMNNSSAWGYPTYPNGPQAASLQALNSMSQAVQLSPGTYTLSFMSCGRPGYSGANAIAVQLNGTTVYTFTPSLTEWDSYSTSLNVTINGSNTIGFVGTINNIYYSSAIQNVQLSTDSSTSSGGTYTYDMCKQSAINNGNQYFGLQSVNSTAATGYCAVTNDYVGATQPGTSTVATATTTLWASSTASSEVSDYGASASLTNTGTLSVYDSSGKAIYSTTSSSSLPANYLGCYADTGTRAMVNTSNNAWYPLTQCQQLAQDGNYTYYAGQDMYVDASGNNANWCAASNDISQVTEYGLSTACTNVNNIMQGGPWGNAVYSTNNSINCFLTLQDDGNMCIYRGTGPSDNQGEIWCSGTNGQQQDANPAYVATAGKYGLNYITAGQTLAPGDFVGSTSGTTALVMQSDGNLVLYTWTMGPNSQTMSDGNTGGGQGATAIYELTASGIPANLGQLGYIDENAGLHTYPADNAKLVYAYSKVPNTDSGGSDYQVNGANIAYGNATVEDCAKTCNSYDDCYGFVTYQGTCYPKTSGISYNGTGALAGGDLYTRNKAPVTVPAGASNTVVNMDTVSYQNYINGGGFASEYGLASELNPAQSKLAQMQVKLNSLANEISSLTGQFETNNANISKQITKNVKESDVYLSELQKTQNSIQNMTTGISNILENSDIVVLQRNYNYMFWSVLAVGLVLVSVNVVKK